MNSTTIEAMPEKVSPKVVVAGATGNARILKKKIYSNKSKKRLQNSLVVVNQKP